MLPEFLNKTKYYTENLLHMWPVSSSVQFVNFITKTIIVIEITNFPKELFLLLAHPIHETILVAAADTYIRHIS